MTSRERDIRRLAAEFGWQVERVGSSWRIATPNGQRALISGSGGSETVLRRLARAGARRSAEPRQERAQTGASQPEAGR